MSSPYADELNAAIATANPHVLGMLSERGRRLYFPKGIISQGAEAKDKAHRVNATLGVATEAGAPMHLKAMAQHFHGLEPADVFLYAPPGGLPELRELWRDKMVEENPRLRGKVMSLPMVTHALTHGLSLVGDMCVDPGDLVVLPDKFWGNYKLILGARLDAEFRTFPFYGDDGGFNVPGFEQTLGEACSERGKAIALMNFPNNPTGYTPTDAEMEQTAEAIQRVADAGHDVVVVSDDAYFGLFYDDASTESLFAHLAQCHERVLPIRLDGATKEFFVWGFRVGFITFAPRAADEAEQGRLLRSLEAKTQGAIRGSVSNCSMPGQSIVCQALRSRSLAEERAAKVRLLAARAAKVKQVLASPAYAASWDCYRFNSGYFMCLRLKGVNAEDVRLRLLDEHGVGVIAVSDTDLRVAFSCLELDEIEPVFEAVHAVVSGLQ